MTTTKSINRTAGRPIACLVALAIAMLAMPTRANAMTAPGTITDRAPFTLTEEQWDMVGDIQQQCYEITLGNRTSTRLEFDASRLLGQREWSADDLGYEPVQTVRAGKTSEDGIVASFAGQKSSVLNYQMNSILAVIRYKTPSVVEWSNQYGWSTVDLTWNKENRDGKWFVSIASATYNCPVLREYRGASEYDVDQGAMQRIRDSVDRAQAIAERHAGEAPLSRIRSYCDEIYGISTSASSRDYSSCTYPWGFTSVFDGDPSTGAVCEGYSRALALLMELSGQHDAECHLMLGWSDSVNGHIRHMWCVIRMTDGRNYLTDVANSQKGTVLYGKGIVSPAQGSVDEGYWVAGDKGGISYTYGDETLELYNADALVISGEPYNEPSYQETGPTEEEEAVPYAPQEDDGDEGIPAVVFSSEQEEAHEVQPLVLPHAKTISIVPEMEASPAPTADFGWVVPAVVGTIGVALAASVAVIAISARRKGDRRGNAYAQRAR